jgi:SAM-dependent methyltransferase
LLSITQSRGWALLQSLWAVKRRFSGKNQPGESESYNADSQGVPAVLSGLSDEEWLDVLIKSIDHPFYRNIELPGFPSEETQKSFVGGAGAPSLHEAFAFYRIVKEYAHRCGHPLNPDSRILDFGCGWGRFTRFFLKDVREENIYAVDAWPLAIDLCRQTGARGNYLAIDHHPPTEFAAESFDLIYAYSVFSHLAESVHLEWVEEFSRLLKPKGILIVTTQGRSFIEYCRSFRDRPIDSLWHEYLSKSFVDAEAALADYDRGKFLYAANGGGSPELPPSLYGEALSPKVYVLREWTRYLSFRDFVEEGNALQQALIVMQK